MKKNSLKKTHGLSCLVVQVARSAKWSRHEHSRKFDLRFLTTLKYSQLCEQEGQRFFLLFLLNVDQFTWSERFNFDKKVAHWVSFFTISLLFATILYLNMSPKRSFAVFRHYFECPQAFPAGNQAYYWCSISVFGPRVKIAGSLEKASFNKKRGVCSVSAAWKIEQSHPCLYWYN